jgi:WhiB family redox-sensing transcriptional regulator
MTTPNLYARTFVRADWMADAQCKGMEVDLFFPERGRDVSKARAVCAECPVQAQCRDYAIDQGIHHGIWGAMSERQRRSVRRSGRPSRGRLLQPCGTMAAYARHKVNGEPTCDACRKVAAEYNRDYRARRAG